MQMSEMYKEIGERILNTRTKRGYTRDFVAGSAGISSKFLYEIENGKKGFSVNVLKNLCEALEVGVDYILTGCKEREYDYKLIKTLEMFPQDQKERVGRLLLEIYRLSNNKTIN